MDAAAIWGLIALALVVGAGLGATLAWRLAQARFKSQLRHTADELQHRHEFTANELRAAQLRAQSELDLARQSFKRQLAAATEGPQAAVLQAEERLRAAYDDIDRLRRLAKRAGSAAPQRADGFAATQPMPDELRS
jgi:hypothetical protein